MGECEVRFAILWAFTRRTKIAREDPRDIIIIFIHIIILMLSYFHVKHGTISGQRVGNYSCLQSGMIKKK